MKEKKKANKLNQNDDDYFCKKHINFNWCIILWFGTLILTAAGLVHWVIRVTSEPTDTVASDNQYTVPLPIKDAL